MKKIIQFNVPLGPSNDISELNKYSGDGTYTKKCVEWFEKKLHSKNLLTTSCTHALEMMAILMNIAPGDEVIMPSYTFVSTANAFVLRGAKVVFVDIRPDTMNIDESLIEAAITDKTRAIAVVHYAGVSCEMDKINSIAKKHNLLVLEDAAQGMMSEYNGKALGTIGDMGTYSFHETKNYHCGEGGLLIINNPKFYKEAEIVREKGTDRSSFLRGEVNKYTWQTVGSSYLPSELNAAFLYSILGNAEKINEWRLKLWNKYFDNLLELKNKGLIELPFIPTNCKHNAHMFYIKLKDLEMRTKFINYMKDSDIICASHYVPLHSSPAGEKYTRFHGKDSFTTVESERLVRLPMFYDLIMEEVDKVSKKVFDFFKEGY